MSVRSIVFSGYALLFLATMAWSVDAAAACSAYKGRATINEIHRSGNNTRFVEVKILDASITSASYDGWSVRICSNSAGCTGHISLGNPLVDDSGYPWIVIPKPLIGDKDLLDIAGGGRMDIMLRDESGRTIDYFSVGSYNHQRDPSCTPAYDWQFDGSNSHTAMRLPDGTGDWAIEGPGGSVDPTDSDTNDVDDKGNPLPVADIRNPDPVVRGTPVVFTVFLPDGPIGHDVTFRYDTLDDTASAGIHYVAASGTAVIPAGESAVNITVQTRVYVGDTERFFYLRLSNQTGAGLNNHFAIATIRPDLGLVAEYRMEEAGWTGASGEAADAAGTSPGTGFGDATTGWQTPVLAGNPGTCRYGVFDGNGDYVQVPHATPLNGDRELTYAAWIHPNAWSGTQQVMGKGIHGGTQMGIFAESGVLKGRAATNSGTVEVQTALPPTGSWTHVALTFRATDLLGFVLPTATVRLYVNGVEAASKTIRGGLFGNARLKSSNAALLLGNDPGRNYFFNGYLDEVRVYDSELSSAWIQTIMQDRHACPAGPGVHHIEILHDGAALTCEPETVTVRACSNADCSTLFTSQDVTVSLAPSGWIGGDTISFNGSTTAQLRKTTSGSVTLATTGVVPAPMTGTVCLAGAMESCNLEFAEAGFVFDVPDHTAETSQSFSVSAVRADDTTQACVPAFSNRTNVPVNFRCTYSNPGSGTMPVRVGQGNTDTPLAASTASACSGGVTIALDFDAAGVAQDVRVIYADVGRMGLAATYTGSGSEAGLVMAGSDSFVAKPASFGLTALRADGTANPAATDADGEVFVRAGEEFTLWVEARNALDQRAPNYGQETAAEGVKLTPSVVLPSSGNDGTLAGTFGAFGVDCTGNPGTKGRACGSHFNWNEVGILALTPTIADGDYLGAGDIPATPVSPFGRFIPHHFDVSSTTPLFAPGCGGFTYLEQDFTYATAPIITITARSMNGSKTSNYTGEFWKLGGLANFTASNAALPAGVGLTQVSAGPTALECLGCGGELSTTLSGTYHYTRSNALIGPFDADPVIKFEVMDGDGVAYGSPPGTYDLGPVGFNTSKTVRSGRAYAQDVYGTGGRIGESLTMPLYAQYFDGSGWVASDSDYCSTFHYSETENDITTALAASGMGYFSGGAAALTLQVSADGGTPGGNSVLTFDWDAVPWFESVSTPAATAIFGAYRNDRRIIHWREAP